MRRILRPKVLIGAFVGLLALYTLVGFVLIPYGIKAYGVPAVSEKIQHPVVLREAAFNPFALSLRLNGLEIREQDQTPILGFDELFVNLRAVTLFLQKIGFDEIRLVMPFVAAKVNHQGKLNLAGLAPPSDQPEPPPPTASEPKKLMPIEIGLLGIDQGIVEYRDESKRKSVTIDVVPIQITLRNFSTVRSEGSENAYAFTAEIGKGETVAWEGTISLEPVESDGKLSLAGIKLKTLYQAVQDQFEFDVQQGVLGLMASYHFDMRGQAPQATVKNGKVSLGNLELGERGTLEPVITIPAFDVDGIEFDLEKQTIDVAKVHSADAQFDAWLASNGVLNYQPLFAPVSGSEPTEKSTSAKAKSEKPAKPWAITVGEVGLKNYRASFEDRTLPKPGHVDVDAMNLTVKDVHIPFKKPLPIDLSLKLNETGSVAVRGKVQVEPLRVDTDVKLEQVEIRPFQPYLDRFLNADIRDGAIDLNGTVAFAKEHATEPLLRFQGNVGVTQLAIAERNVSDDVVGWKALNVNQIALDVEPTAVKIAEVVWQEPSIDIVVDAKGQLNLSRLAVPSQPAEPAAVKKEEPEGEKSAGTASEPVPVTIDQVKLVKMLASFQDLSIEPKVRTGLREFGGTIKGLSSKQLKKADVNLAGKVGRAAPLKIIGKINPLSEDAFTDLIVTLGGMDLAPTGPYSGKYVGYGLSKGKLSLDLKYKVSQKVLEAENLLRVDQLTFGDKTNSPDATSLPVPLVVGLLKDRKGVIEIDMPIRGNLNDPDFKYGKVVISTLLNLLTKVVASPFSLMGKLIPGGEGGGEEDLQFVQFEPGSASVTDEEAQKLEALEKALDERAGLRLDITGTSDGALDRAALQRIKLREQLFAMKGGSRTGAKAGQADLSPKDEQRLVEKLYAKLPPSEPIDSSSEATQPTLDGMKEKLAAAIDIPESELQALARQRAEAIRNRLLDSGKLTEDRVSVLDPGAAESGHDKVRTQLALSAGS